MIINSKPSKITLKIVASLFLVLFIVGTIAWRFCEYQVPIYTLEYPVILDSYFIISPIIYSSLLFRVWIKKYYDSIMLALILWVLFLLFIEKPYSVKVDRAYLEDHLIVVGVVVDKQGGRGTSDIEVRYYDGEVYRKGTFHVSKKMYSLVDFHKGDTVILKYSVSRPEISRIYRYKPTKEEIKEYKFPKRSNKEGLKDEN